MTKRYALFRLPLSIEKKAFLVLSALVTCTIPLKPSHNSITLVILLLYWLVFLPKSFDKRRLQFVVMVSALFWLALAGMIYTRNINEGLFRLQQKLILLVVPLIFGTVDFDWQKEFRWIVSILIATALAASLVCLGDGLLYFIRNASTDRFFSDGLVEYINLYPYIMALVCLIAVLVISEAFLQKISLHKWLHQPVLAITMFVFFSLMIFLLSVKQIIIAWLVFFVINALRLKASRIRVLVVLAFGFITLVFSVILIPTLRLKAMEVLSNKDNTIPLDIDASLGRNWNGIALRKAIWTCSVDVIKNDPIFGVGTGDGQDALQSAYERRMFYFASRHNLYNTHNQYLQTLVNFGVIGLFIWLFSLFEFWRTFRHFGLILNLLGCLIFAMLTESMLETNKGILLMAFCTTLFPLGNTQLFTKNR